MTYSSKRKEINQSLTLRTDKKFVLASFSQGRNIENKLTPLYVMELYITIIIVILEERAKVETW